MFKDRTEAGNRLAEKLQEYKDKKNTLVIGLPRGGVPVAYQVSRQLGLSLDIVCPRKIGAPMHKEFAIGAITETGEGIFDANVISRLNIKQDYIQKEVEKEKWRAKNRLETYRQGKGKRNLKDKTIIIVDDGLATGSTMKAAIQSIKSEGADKVVVAVPVSPPDTLEEIEALVDHVVCLQTPLYFQAVGQFYTDFSPTEDEEVIALMRSSNESQ